MARYLKKSTPKLTEELIEEISQLIQVGAYIETAVAYAGVSKDTFYIVYPNGDYEVSDSTEFIKNDKGVYFGYFYFHRFATYLGPL